MFSVAITGEIGAGKSTLASVWSGMGASVISLDALAKRQWELPGIRKAAEARWGRDVYFPGGTPDFKKLAGFIYSGDDEYRFAMSLIHPGALTGAAKAFHRLGGWVVIEVPLLYETGWFDLIDYAVYITAPAVLRLERMALRGWDAKQLAARERFMMDSLKKQAMSDAVMDNAGSAGEWEARAREAGALMREMSSVHELNVFCGEREEAGKIASTLVENRLAAGANIMGADSAFWWKGGISRIPEYLVRALTVERNLRPAMRQIRRISSYEVPAVTAREIQRSDYQTLKWVVDSCRAADVLK